MSNETKFSSKGVLGFDPDIVRYGSIFLLIVGTFGNVLSCIIFSQGVLRKSSTFRYLAILSLMDLLVLYSGLVDLFLAVESRGTISIRNLHIVSCRLHTFITYWSQHSSSWILSFISVDRAIATNCIKFARKFCTPRSANYVVGVILLLLFLFNCHELIFLHLHTSSIVVLQPEQTTLAPPIRKYLQQSSRKSQIQTLISICDNSLGKILCSKIKRDLSIPTTTAANPIPIKSKPHPIKCAALRDSRYEYFWNHIWEWFDVCLYAIIPFTVMCIGTFFIVYRVYYQQRRVFRSRRSASNNPINNTPNKAKSLFYLLFTLNLLYFLLVSPVVFVTTIYFRIPNTEFSHPRMKALIYFMQYCNHSLNFIFYGITSPPYRRILCEWFQILIPYLPQFCQQKLRERTKTDVNTNTVRITRKEKKESISLIPR